MEISWIRSFLCIVDEGGFSAAARKLHTAQPALTRQIQQLEEDVGTALLWRTTRAVKPTAAGVVFAQEARGWLRQIETAGADARRAARGEVGRLRIGYFAAGSAPFLPRLVQAYRTRYPGVRVELVELNPVQQVAALEAQQIDAAFNRPVRADARAWLHQETVYQDRLVAALPDGHPLAARKTVALRQLKNEPFLLFSRAEAPEMIDGLTGHCRRAGFSPRIVGEVPLMSTLVCHVACGMGITIIPSCVHHLGQRGVSFLPITPALPALPLVFIHPRVRTLPTVSGFHDILRDELTAIRTLMEPRGRR
jgi:DNA-binding transcriptional LysR family regulator